MSDPYERVKGGRLTFKDGTLATRSKAIDKKKNKKKKKKLLNNPNVEGAIDSGSAVDLEGDDAIAAAEAAGAGAGAEEEEESYSIDAAKRMKYDELFPVEAKKFGYDPKAIQQKSVEAVLDDRVKKKADRYCK
ncbi:hypothetical protein RchiOBHm_Chr7g0177391 [Rosa chinensis]|uniref:Uncharacterized protein n=1 Tax=Rosa chinensis TaxID=74649 RepID=A0A2P6P1K1_ROSCH|nr:uncharacterized protein LOC112180029 [Rosa chinensis]PRQ15800.1 hypothetical protein RchiOBHm_Chr7g0177391 [Rosa chinensis]